MARRKSPPESVLADSTNTGNAQQAKQCLPGKQEGGPAATCAPVTFSRKNKVTASENKSGDENTAGHTPQVGSRKASMAESASPSLTDFLTPLVSESQDSPESFISARTEVLATASSTKTSRFVKPAQANDVLEEAGGKGRRAAYPRRVAPSRDEQQGTAHAAYMARMAAHFAEVDDFALAVDSPSAAGAASPDVAPQPVQQDSAQHDHKPHAEHHMAPSNDSTASAYTAQWVQATVDTAAEAGDGLVSELIDGSAAAPEPTQLGDASQSAAAAAAHSVVKVIDESQDAASGQHAELAAGEASLQGGMPAKSGVDQIEQRRLTLTAPEEAAEEDAEGEDSISIPLVRVPRRSSVAGRASHKGATLATLHAGRLSLAHARKSLAGTQLLPMERRARLESLPIHPAQGRVSNQGGKRRTSVYEALASRFSLSQGLSRVSLGLSGALNRLSLGPAAGRKSSLVQGDSHEAAAEGPPTATLLEDIKRAISPIAESPDQSERDTSATPEAVSVRVDCRASEAAQAASHAPQRSSTDALTQQLDAKLRITEELVPEQALAPAEDLTPLQQLFRLCDQQTDIEELPSMEQLLGRHVKLKGVKKIGEGTFGEAFKGGDLVFKIVPMEGSMLVNGEPQKRAEEITAEVAIALTLSQLHPESRVAAPNSTQGFVQTYGCGVCRGRYAGALVKEWRAWDKRNGSENDPVNAFGNDQLFVVFVVANGGADLEHFEVHSFEEARSIILQTVLALAVAEEAVQFEHRDLHWGNLLINRVPAGQRIACTLRGVSIGAESHGVQITLIDFTLSRLCTIDGAGAYCDLEADLELFQGPKGDCQADTYRRMRKATKGRWEGFHPATNALWMHYLADTLLNLKAFPLDAGQKRQLRDFRKRALSARSCSDLLMDEFLRGSWLAGS